MVMLRTVSNVHQSDILVMATLLQIYLLSLEQYGFRKPTAHELVVIKDVTVAHIFSVAAQHGISEIRTIGPPPNVNKA